MCPSNSTSFPITVRVRRTKVPVPRKVIDVTVWAEGIVEIVWVPCDSESFERVHSL